MSGPYDDMIDLPHHVSTKHPRMSISNRAAQFAPFAALSGYDGAVRETARQTDERIELDENMVAALDIRLRLLIDRLADRPEVSVTYFRADERKEGGAYVTAAGAVKKIDDYEGVIVLTSGDRIPIADILHIESALFRDLI